MSDLLPCPFCGEHVSNEEPQRHDPDNTDAYWVYCHGCGAQGPVHMALQIAAVRWNRRAGDRRETLEELKRELGLDGAHPSDEWTARDIRQTIDRMLEGDREG